MTEPTLSAIIPTRDRPELLADALRSLMTQTIADFEVVVVDDGSEPSLEPVVGGVKGRVPVKYVRQDPAGLNVGRNTGAAHARGTVLAYLDDDTIVAPRWAEAVLDSFRTRDCAAMAGRIQLWFEGEAPGWLTPKLRSYLSELDLGEESFDVPPSRSPFGANCAVSRDWFDRIGGFVTGLDRNGASLVSNGDIEFFRRLREAGGTVTYRPEAAVLHRVPPERLTPEFFRRRAFAQGVSDILDGGDRSVVTGVAREAIRRGRALPILAKGLVRGHGARPAAYWLEYSRGRAHALRGRSA